MKKIICLIIIVLCTMQLWAQVIFEEDFEGCVLDEETNVASVPMGWTVYEDNLSALPDYAIWGNGWCVYQAQGRSKMAISVSRTHEGDMSDLVVCDRWLITPQISIDWARAELSFKLGGNSAMFPETVMVMISTTSSDKASFTMVQRYNGVSNLEERVIDLSAYEGEDIYVAFVNCGNGMYAMLDDIKVEAPAITEARLVEADVPFYTLQGSEISVGGIVENSGMQMINSFEAYYEVDGEKSSVSRFENLSIGAGERYHFSIEEGYSTMELGTKGMKVCIRGVNGDSLLDLQDTMIWDSTTVYNYSLVYDRKVLLEHFTASTCLECVGIDRRIEDAIEGRSDVIRVVHHTGMYEDEMTIPENESMLEFYNGSDVMYCPGVMFDRTHIDSMAKGPICEAGSTSEFVAKIDAAVETPALARVDIKSTSYDENSRSLIVRLSGEIMEGFVMNSPRISVYLVEDSVRAPQAGFGDMYHMDVMRDAITDVWGEEWSGNSFEKVYVYQVPTEFDVAHCRVVAFISNYSNDVNNRMVMNADVTEYYVNEPYVGLDATAEKKTVMLYPNPSSKFVVISSEEVIREVWIYDMKGMRVYENEMVDSIELRLNVDAYRSGMYRAVIKTDSGYVERSMMVVR